VPTPSAEDVAQLDAWRLAEHKVTPPAAKLTVPVAAFGSPEADSDTALP
jgi:hypothetical protein